MQREDTRRRRAWFGSCGLQPYRLSRADAFGLRVEHLGDVGSFCKRGQRRAAASGEGCEDGADLDVVTEQVAEVDRLGLVVAVEREARLVHQLVVGRAVLEDDYEPHAVREPRGVVPAPFGDDVSRT